MEEKIYEKEKF